MALLPKTIRYRLFDALSRKTMRYVDAVPRAKATGLVAEVYQQIARDFFVNGSLSSRSQVASLFASTWCLGRETIIVNDHIDRVTKEAMVATLSDVNDCPYCGDMLVSLVHAGDQSETAQAIYAGDEASVTDPLMRERLRWVRAVATPGQPVPARTPFRAEELPEILGSMLAMSDINRFSHVVMAGSPVNEPFGSKNLKASALRLFAGELVPTQHNQVRPGDAIDLLPQADLPEDMHWASGNPRIADALARSAATIEGEGAKVISPQVRQLVHENLRAWQGSVMPMSRAWVDLEVGSLSDQDQPYARFALLLAKASYQLDESTVEDIVNRCGSQPDFIRLLAWCSFTAARHVTARIARTMAAPAALAA